MPIPSLGFSDAQATNQQAGGSPNRVVIRNFGQGHRNDVRQSTDWRQDQTADATATTAMPQLGGGGGLGGGFGLGGLVSGIGDLFGLGGGSGSGGSAGAAVDAAGGGIMSGNGKWLLIGVGVLALVLLLFTFTGGED